MERTNRACRRCLTREMNREEYFKNLHTYIDNLEEDRKAEPVLYETRLRLCKECKWLQEGMCRTCGCFVEMRAAIRKQRCPYEKW